MSGALDKDPETGHIRYDDTKCSAYFMCVMNCPYGIPKPDRVTRNKVIRCDFCDGNDDGPNCVRSCPRKAIHIKEVSSVMKHVIIGAGAAGLTAAKTIRALRPSDDIIVISEDDQVISRCMLHKCINGERDPVSISFVPEDFFEQSGIEWRGGIRVTGVNTAMKAVCFDSGCVGYDKLLIAAGSEVTLPPIGTLRTANNVYGLRNLPDANNIRNAAMHASKVVDIGAGLVGLDAAYSLLDMGKHVTVVEMMPHLIPLSLDEKSAGAYQERFEAAGCEFLLGRKVENTTEDVAGNLTHIHLDDGSVLPCDFVVVAVGVHPAIGFLGNSDIIHGPAVKVDSHMSTNDPDVYAAGDAAGLSGIWPSAMRQGEVAAKNMCGFDAEYTDRLAARNTINFYGLQTLSVGEQEPVAGDAVKSREDAGNYRRIILRDGYVKGVILQGDISGSGFWRHLIKEKIRIDGVNKSIWKLSFADFCAFNGTGEYRWAV